MTNLLIVVVILLVIGVLFYNTLVSRCNQCDNLFATIDALLKKRYDLIPNLVTLLKESMAYEKGLLEEVVRLRSEAVKPGLDERKKMAIAEKVTKPLHGMMIMERILSYRANRGSGKFQTLSAKFSTYFRACRTA